MKMIILTKKRGKSQFLGNCILKVSDFVIEVEGTRVDHLNIMSYSGNNLIWRSMGIKCSKAGLVIEFFDFGPPTFGRKGSYKITPVVS